jgi:nucleotide-binding universal stress UspA family protein
MACLDRSELGEACLPYASFMARALGAELTLVHVMPSPNDTEPGAFDVLGWEISRREAEQYLARVQEDLERRGLAAESVRVALTQGQPSSRVLALERQLRPELTVLSRRGEGGPAWNLGATVQRIIMNASGSVLLVPPDGATGAIPPRRIMVPLDGSPRAECVLPIVLEAAREQGAEVLLVHVVSEPSSSGVLADAKTLDLARALASRLQAGGQSYLGQVRDQLLRVLPRVKVLVLRRADTHEALLDAARDEGADLIVLSAHGATCNAYHAFGSVTAHTLAHATLPVLILQDLPASERPRSDRPPAGTGDSAGSGRTPLPSRAVPH